MKASEALAYKQFKQSVIDDIIETGTIGFFGTESKWFMSHNFDDNSMDVWCKFKINEQEIDCSFSVPYTKIPLFTNPEEKKEFIREHFRTHIFDKLCDKLKYEMASGESFSKTMNNILDMLRPINNYK